jgi:hypothetical protein
MISGDSAALTKTGRFDTRTPNWRARGCPVGALAVKSPLHTDGYSGAPRREFIGLLDRDTRSIEQPKQTRFSCAAPSSASDACRDFPAVVHESSSTREYCPSPRASAQANTALTPDAHGFGPAIPIS